MKPFKNLSISFFYFQFFVSTLIFISLLAYAARFDIKNNCNITIWAAAVPGGGRQINPGGTWSLEVTPPRTSVAFGPELSAVSMDPGLVNVKLVTVVGFFNAKAMVQPHAPLPNLH